MKKKRGAKLIELLIVIVIVVVLVWVIIGSGLFKAPDNGVAINALQNAGYTNIEVLDVGGDTWGDDDWIFTCRAKNLADKEVTLYVSYSTGKGSTIRHK